ncbi:TadE/TadG family type IV pilus assembly protein [Sphingopyxis sp.]|jgi:Flp pilus assembly protein TadG|uniref:TadE/TadG family type IV pilus assembly protein n=1 Tax=Sphingopyxis sp. TaxID=1908224 RepID=UPI002E0BF6F0|nr:TadE/TadG family type IV pilus assembly protein [Sphingopyxis sp.]
MTRRLTNLARRLRGHQRGTAITEFALTAPLFLLLLMGIFDYSWQFYARQVLQGAVAKAARDSTLEGNAASQAVLDEKVRTAVKNVFGKATVTFTRQTYDSFDAVGKPEPFKDKNGNNQYDAGECFEDINANGSWDADRGRAGNGGADDIVLYTASMEFNRILPVWSMLGQPQKTILKQSTVLRNQPYNAGTNANPVKCT